MMKEVLNFLLASIHVEINSISRSRITSHRILSLISSSNATTPTTWGWEITGSTYHKKAWNIEKSSTLQKIFIEK